MKVRTVKKTEINTLRAAPVSDRCTKTIILEAASAAFRQFGFRKTSLNDVAQAADVSRQSIYLHFRDKETLFQQTFEFDLCKNLTRVADVLDHCDDPQQALTEAFRIWHGQYIHRFSRLKAERNQPAIQLSMKNVTHSRAQFIDVLAEFIARTSALKRHSSPGITPDVLATTLLSTSRGLSASTSTESEFTAAMQMAICAIFDLAPSRNS